MSGDTTPQDQYFEADGIRLHSLDRGNDTAPPMLLLHGFSGHAHTATLHDHLMLDPVTLIGLSMMRRSPI
jgi:pimeloyl-ACP methyl ester carboxylesterase